MTKHDLFIDKKNSKQKRVKQMKRIKRKPTIKKIKSSTLVSVYNKIEAKQQDAIKKRRTIKKNKNIFLNKKITKMKDKKLKIHTGGIFGFSKEKKAINKYKKNSKIIIEKLNEYTTEFKNIYGYYKNQQKILNDNYILKFNREINIFLDGIIDKKYIINNIDKKKSEEYNIMKTRMVMLNKIYRFSTAVGQTLRTYKTFNINVPKNFYYKQRHSRTVRSLKKKDNSKIKRNFAISYSLWGNLGVYREYELKLEKIKSEIKALLLSHEEYTENIKIDINTINRNKIVKKKDEKESKESEGDVSVNEITKEELNKLKELKVKLTPIYNEYNSNLDTDIHYYIPKIKVTNINLILMDFPKKSQYTNFKDFIRKDNIKYDEDEEYDTSDTGLIDKHKEGNRVLFEKSSSLINMYFDGANDILNRDSFLYLTNYIKLHNIQNLFHNISILYLYNLEKKPYVDMGQVSMLSYENKIDASLSDIKKSKRLVYLDYMDYYNNILHLPRFILNHLKVCMLKTSKEIYNDDFYGIMKNEKKENNKEIQKDMNILEELEDKKIKGIINSDKQYNKFKTKSLGLKTEKKIQSIEEASKEQFDNSNKIYLDTDKQLSNIDEDDKNFFLPISSYHAMFKIRDFTSIKNIKFTRDWFTGFFYTKKIKINNREIENGNAISKLFYINKNKDIIPGTIIYLYKQIAFLIHFIFGKTSKNENLLYQSFLEDILNFSIEEKIEGVEDKIEKNIKRNIGIFTGVDKRKIYVSYVMIVFIQHLNRLLECIIDLEYLTEKLFYTYKKDTNARKIFRDEIDRISRQEDYTVDKKSTEKDKILYSFDDKLKDFEINDELKNSSYEYKRLIYKIKNDVDRTKSLDEINELINAIVTKIGKDNVKPRISLTDYFELTRESETSDKKFNPENNIYELYLNDPKVKGLDKSYFKTLIEQLFFQAGTEEIGAHSTEFLKTILNRNKETEPDKINSLKAELYYLVLLFMDIKNEPIMKGIKKQEVNDKTIADEIKLFLKKMKFKNVELKEIYNNFTLKNKVIFMREFNILHKDNFIFFTKKMYENNKFLLTSLLTQLSSYNKEYPYTSKLVETINECKSLLSEIETIDDEIKTKVVNVIKDNIISSSKFLLVNYKHDGTPNIDFEIKSEPLNEELDFIELWKEETKFPPRVELQKKIPINTITAIEKEGLNENILDNIPEIILGHNTFKDKIVENKKDEFEVLFEEKEKLIKQYNEKIILVSFFKIIINKFLKNETDSNGSGEIGEHSSVDEKILFSKRSDIFYPIQFIFLNSNLYDKDNYNYLQYSKMDIDFKDSNKINEILKELLEQVSKKFIEKYKSEVKDSEKIKSIDDSGLFKKNPIDNFRIIKNNIQEQFKNEQYFVELVKYKNIVKKLQKIINEYNKDKGKLSVKEKNRQIENIKKLKRILNDYYKLTLTDENNVQTTYIMKDDETNDFSDIENAYKQISIVLSFNKEDDIIEKYKNSFLQQFDMDSSNTSLVEIPKGPKINLEKSGVLIKNLVVLYKKYIQIVLDQINRLTSVIFKARFRNIDKFNTLKETEDKKKVNDLILIMINIYLKDNSYIKRIACETKGECEDKDIAEQTFIPYLVSKLKQTSVTDFINGDDVIISEFKTKIKLVSSKFKDKDLEKLENDFNQKSNTLINRILNKVKKYFILVDKETLDKGASSG